jgi:rubrerythrin
MFSDIPLNIEREDVQKQVARAGMIAELDAANEYEQLLSKLQRNSSRYEEFAPVINDVISEEKKHMGMFLQMLEELDPQAKMQIMSGMKEAEKLEKEVL